MGKCSPTSDFLRLKRTLLPRVTAETRNDSEMTRSHPPAVRPAQTLQRLRSLHKGNWQVARTVHQNGLEVPGGFVSERSRLGRWGALFVIALLVPVCVVPAHSEQQEAARKVKTRVAPQYPELARRLKIGGTVKIEVRVAADGKVKSTKVVGGPPLLIESAVEAVKRWKFESAPSDTIGVVEVKFDAVPTMDARK